VEKFCEEERFLHAENLLQSVAQAANLRLRFTNIRAMRVRADGGTVRSEFDVRPHEFFRGVIRKRIHKLRTILGRS
jgi:hypothetical protein